MSLPTPNLSHLTRDVLEQVYEPAEDTFLLLDALEMDVARWIRVHQRAPTVCLEIGSGSGCVSAFLGQLLRRESSSSLSFNDGTNTTNAATTTALLLCTDMNPRACQCAKMHRGTRGLATQIPLEPVQTRFTASLMQRLKHSVDILIFNPPYVVTPSQDVVHQVFHQNHSNQPSPTTKDSLLQAAWAGGIDGREVVDRLIQEQVVPTLLSPHGVFYLVAIHPNRPHELVCMFRQQCGLEGEILMERKAGIERLYILKFTRK